METKNKDVFSATDRKTRHAPGSERASKRAMNATNQVMHLTEHVQQDVGSCIAEKHQFRAHVALNR